MSMIMMSIIIQISSITSHNRPHASIYTTGLIYKPTKIQRGTVMSCLLRPTALTRVQENGMFSTLLISKDNECQIIFLTLPATSLRAVALKRQRA